MYRIVSHWGSGEVSYALADGALVVVREKSGRREVVPFADITTVNLREELHGAWTMQVARRRGSRIVVPARHFVALGRFELRAAEYRAFVDAFHRACRAANPDIRYVTGSSGLYVFGVVLLVLTAVFVAMLAYGSTTARPPPARLFAVVPLGVVVGGAFVKQGRAKRYDPSAPPPAYLPPAA